MLRDILLGLLPVYVGDVIDFLHKANKKNMALIDGFVNDDKEIIRRVNQKAIQSAVVFIFLIFCICIVIWLLTYIVKEIGSHLFT